jgi:hypothetical protein
MVILLLWDLININLYIQKNHNKSFCDDNDSFSCYFYSKRTIHMVLLLLQHFRKNCPFHMVKLKITSRHVFNESVKRTISITSFSDLLLR